MSKERFQSTGKTSFYGDYLYDRIVPRGHFLPSLIESDLAQDLPIGTCTADRAYDDTDNHFFLQTRGIRNAIHLNRYRRRKRDPNRRCGEAAKQVWMDLKAQPWYKYRVWAQAQSR